MCNKQLTLDSILLTQSIYESKKMSISIYLEGKKICNMWISPASIIKNDEI